MIPVLSHRECYVHCQFQFISQSSITEQLQNIDNFCLMNHPQVWTTINKTEIDLSLLPVGKVSLTDWYIYPGLFSDHLAVLLEIQHQHNTESVSVPKRWFALHADWELYQEHITTDTTSITWTYIDINEANITKAILESAELSILKSLEKTSITPYWNITWELGGQITVAISN